MSEKQKIIRPGCFEGDKDDPKSLCRALECDLAAECIWNKEIVPRYLGVDNNRTEAMGPQVR